MGTEEASPPLMEQCLLENVPFLSQFNELTNRKQVLVSDDKDCSFACLNNVS